LAISEIASETRKSFIFFVAQHCAVHGETQSARSFLFLSRISVFPISSLRFPVALDFSLRIEPDT